MHPAAVLALASLALGAPPNATAPCALPPAAGAAAWIETTPRAAGDSLATAVVCVAPRDTSARLGSYRGELRWDAAAWEAAGAERPAGGLRVENLRAAGVAKFAGASPDGFDAGPQLVLRLRPRRAGAAPPRLALQVHELHDVRGRPLAP